MENLKWGKGKDSSLFKIQETDMGTETERRGEGKEKGEKGRKMEEEEGRRKEKAKKKEMLNSCSNKVSYLPYSK